MKTTQAKKKKIPVGYCYAEVGESLRPSAMWWNRYVGEWQFSQAVVQPGEGVLRCNAEKSYIVPEENI